MIDFKIRERTVSTIMAIKKIGERNSTRRDLQSKPLQDVSGPQYA